MSNFRLNRILSKPLTALFLRSPMTPNQITTLSLSLGLAAGYLFSQGRYGASLAAACLYALAVILDNCDGEVARAKNMRSPFGAWYDIAADFLTDLSLFGGVALGALRNDSEGPVAVFTVLTISGAFLHVLLVILEKIRGFGPAVHNTPHPEHEKRVNPVRSVFDALREGESSWLVLLLALSGNILWLLWLGGIYMQLLWMTALFLNFKWLFLKKRASSG